MNEADAPDRSPGLNREPAAGPSLAVGREPATGPSLVVGLLLIAIVAAAALTRVHVHVEEMGKFMIQGDTGVYVSMAVNLPYGLGLYSPADATSFTAASAYGYNPSMAASRSELVPFYGGLDLGLTFIYWLAIKLFGAFVPPILALCWLQIIVDCLNVVGVFVLGRRLLGPWAGLVAAALYAGLWSAVLLSSAYPFYYYWTGAFSIWCLLLVARFLDEGFPRQSVATRVGLAILYGLILGLASMTRSFFLPLGILSGALIVVRHRAHWRSVLSLVCLALAVQMLVLAPGFWRNYERYGRFNLRWKWHTAYIGLGGHPNPWGIKWDDRDGFAAARARGLRDDDPDYVVKYDDVMREVVMEIYRQHPGLIARNFALNLYDGFCGFDGALGLEWRLRYGAKTTVPWQPPPMLSGLVATPQACIALLLALQIPAWFLFFRTRIDRWLYAAVLLCGGYTTVFIAFLCPPFLEYNSPYDVCFVLCMAAVLCALAFVPLSWMRAALAAFDPQMRKLLPYALGWLLLPSLCDRHLRFFAHLGEVAVAFAACLSAWMLLQSWSSARAARLGFLCAIGLSGAGLLATHLHVWDTLGPSAAVQLLVASLLLLGWQRGALPAWLFALLSIALSGGHPEITMLPLVLAMLLLDLPADGIQRVGLAGFAFGLAAFVAARLFPGVLHLRDAVFLVPLATALAATSAPALRRFRWPVALILVAALTVVKGLAPIGLLPAVLLLTAVRDRQ